MQSTVGTVPVCVQSLEINAKFVQDHAQKFLDSEELLSHQDRISDLAESFVTFRRFSAFPDCCDKM